MENIQENLQRIDEKKKRLDAVRPLPSELVKNLQEWLAVEFTYTSNAIEGNTLSLSETAMVVEKGITIGGKTLQEHIELIDCARAVEFITMRAQTLLRRGFEGQGKNAISVEDICTLYKYTSEKIDPSLDLIVFTQWLNSITDHPVIIAALAHYKLATIHDGKTARLLMNLLLLQYGYPLAIIKKEQRPAYIDAIEHARETDDFSQFYAVIIAAVEYSLDVYLDAIEQSNLP